MFNLRPENSQTRIVRAENARAESARNDWTLAHTASLLKFVLYAGVGVSAWLLLRSDTQRGALEPNIEEPSSDDYSTWEPEQ